MLSLLQFFPRPKKAMLATLVPFVWMNKYICFLVRSVYFSVDFQNIGASFKHTEVFGVWYTKLVCIIWWNKFPVQL